MPDKDCNTCKHHVQGAAPDPGTAPCWPCGSSKGFPAWTSHEDAHVGGALGTQVAGNHYKEFVIQPIEFAMSNGLNACQAKVVKYVCRKKGDLKKQLEDLDKAIHVIELYKQLLNDGKSPIRSWACCHSRQ